MQMQNRRNGRPGGLGVRSDFRQQWYLEHKKIENAFPCHSLLKMKSNNECFFFFLLAKWRRTPPTGNHKCIQTCTLRPGEMYCRDYMNGHKQQKKVGISSQSLASLQLRGCSTPSAATIRVGFASQDHRTYTWYGSKSCLVRGLVRL